MRDVLGTMEGTSPLKKLPNKSDIQDISLELGIDPSFVEKDWYAVQLLVLLSELQSTKDFKIAFSASSVQKFLHTSPPYPQSAPPNSRRDSRLFSGGLP